MTTSNQEFPTLLSFRDWWVKKGAPIRPPFKNPVFITDIAYAVCIFRHKQYQVELFITKPNTCAPYHSHPGVESSFMYLAGSLNFLAPGVTSKFNVLDFQYENPETGAHILLGQTIDLFAAGGEHTVAIGPEGGCFLSFEKWENDIEPVSVTVNWEGESIGKEHNNSLTEHKEYVPSSTLDSIASDKK